MTNPLQRDNIVRAIHLGDITEQEATKLLLALKHGDQVAVKKLMEEHGQANK